MFIYKKIINKYRKLGSPIKASLWFVICNVIQKSMHFILVPIFTRMMTTAEYGRYSVFTSWELIFAVFAGLNLAGNSYNVGMIKNENDQERYTSSIQGLWWLNTILVGGFVLLTHNFWQGITGLNFSFLIAVFIHIFATSSVDLWTAKQKFHFQYKGVVILTLCLVVFTILVSIYSINIFSSKDGAAVWSKVGVLFVLSVVTGFINLYYGKTLYDKKYWIQALKFNIPLIAYYLSIIILSQSDKLMIDRYCGPDKAGIYSVANSFAHILVILNTAINGSFVPWEFRKIKSKEYFEIPKITNVLLLLVASANVLLMCVAPEIIHIMTTPEYYRAIWVIPPITISTFFTFVYQLFVNIEFYYEKKYYVMAASIGVSILNIILNSLFIPKFGFIAAGYTTAVSYICFTVVHYIFMKHICFQVGEHTDIYDISGISKICVLMVLLMFVFIGLYMTPVWIRYAVIFAVIAGICIYIKKNNFTIQMIIKMKGSNSNE